MWVTSRTVCLASCGLCCWVDKREEDALWRTQGHQLMQSISPSVRSSHQNRDQKEMRAGEMAKWAKVPSPTTCVQSLRPTLTPSSCPLTSTQTPWFASAHTVTHNKWVNAIQIFTKEMRLEILTPDSFYSPTMRHGGRGGTQRSWELRGKLLSWLCSIAAKNQYGQSNIGRFTSS